MATMFKGARKAIVRAPHRIAGHKSTEDRTIIEWNKDFATAEAAMDLMATELGRHVSAWRDVLAQESKFQEVYRQLAEPIVEENAYRSVQETPESTMRTVRAYGEALESVRRDADVVLKQLQDHHTRWLREARECLAGVQKALKKREHKKVDYDRHSNTVEKLLAKETLTEKESAQLQKTEGELDTALELFQAQDQKLRETVPYVLTTLSEFLSLMSATLALSEHKLLGIVRQHLFAFAQAHGLTAPGGAAEPATYDDIGDAWEKQFNIVQPKVEQGISIIREGGAPKSKLSLPSTRKMRDSAGSMAGSVAGHTTQFAQKAHQRLKHPSVASIEFSSPSQGMFRKEADPLSGPPPYTSGRIGGPAGIRSPSSVKSPDPDDEETRRRVRAFSSASVRSQLYDPRHVFPKSDRDEYVVAAWTFEGEEPGDVSFKEGDRVRVLDHGDANDPNWWLGETADGRVGLFPSNYTKPEKSSASPVAQSPSDAQSDSLSQSKTESQTESPIDTTAA